MLQFIKRAALAAVVAGAGWAGTAARAQETIKIDGSSTVYPITEAVAEEYAKDKSAARVTAGYSGTGGGFKKFVRNEIEISGASRPISSKEMEDARKGGIEYIELPVAFDALTVVIHPKNTWAKELTVEDLKKMWGPDSKAQTWKDVRPEWPATPLKLYGPGTDSGTFDYFTEAINGKAKASRADYTASEDDNVLVQGVSGNEGALGYFGLAYYLANKDKLQAVAVVNPQTKKGVLPTEATVIDGSYAPLARPIFIYVNKSALSRPAVAKFAQFYLENGPDMAKKVKYVPLPDEAYEKGLARLKARQSGTAYGGAGDVGMKIKDLFEKPLKQ